MSNREYDRGHGIQLGKGLDIVNNTSKGDCVIRTSTDQEGGQETDYEWLLIRSREQLAKVLNISISASLRNDIAQVGGSVKFKYFKQRDITRYSVFFVTKCTVKLPEAIMRDVNLKEQDRDLLANDKETFRAKCGDEFVIGFVRGAEFYSIFEFTTESEESFNSIVAELDVSGSTSGNDWSISGDYVSVIKNLQSKVQYFHKIHQEGGLNVALPSDDPDEIQKYARQFPTTVTQENSIKYNVITADYATVDNRPIDIDPIKLAHAETVIKELGKDYMDYQDRLSNVKYALRHPDQFVQSEYDAIAITQLKGRLEETLDNLVKTASNCYTNPGNCQFPDSETFPDIVVQLPPRLSRTVRGAIELAKKNYGRAKKHAEDCIELTSKILEISRSIQVGPKGKELADRATVLLSSAHTSKKNVTRAREDLEAIPQLSDDIDVWLKKAINAEESAINSFNMAKTKKQLVYDVGYSPYWKAPIVFYLNHSSFKDISFTLNIFEDRANMQNMENDLRSLAVDPSGGTLMLKLCDGQTYDHSGSATVFIIPPEGRDPSLLYEGHSDENYGTGIVLDQYASVSKRILIAITAPDTPSTGDSGTGEPLVSTEWNTPFIIISDKTNLATKVNARSYCHNSPHSIVRHENYISGNLVVHGKGPYESGLIESNGNNSVNPNEALGWRDSITSIT